MDDRGRIYAAAFLRALATGMVGVLLGLYLARLHLRAGQIGLVTAAGLTGSALATLAATLAADRIGRRRFLVWVALLGGGGGLLVALGSGASALAAGALLGMVNGMGRDRGAALVLEQAILPATAASGERTRAFAWYNVLQDSGHALGGLLAAAPALLCRALPSLDQVLALRLGLGLYAALVLATSFLYLTMSPGVEAGTARSAGPVSPASRRILWRICALFGLDSLAGGFLTSALLSFYFFERFGVDEIVIGPLFFAARVANAASHLGAAWLARRIGLVNTMVFTHIPSNLLLVTVAFAPSFPWAALLFLLREGLVEMDVPTRQSYVMALVRPEERTLASGATTLVRVSGWAAAPSVAGFFMQGVALGAPLFVAAIMKIAYDVLLYVGFRRVRAPEERGASPPPPATDPACGPEGPRCRSLP